MLTAPAVPFNALEEVHRLRANIAIMSALAAVLLLAALVAGGAEKAGEGLKQGAVTLWRIWPLLLLALVVAGLLHALVPVEAVQRYLGTARPYRAILIAWIVGAVLPGAPYVTLPLAAMLLGRGAGIGAATTLVLSASLVGLTRVPYEVAFVGWQFSVLRVAACLVLAPVAGAGVHLLNVLMRFYPVG